MEIDFCTVFLKVGLIKETIIQNICNLPSNTYSKNNLD